MRTWSESNFILSYLKLRGKGDIVLPTADQDKFEHWDSQIDGIKYEVKGQKHVNQKVDKEFTIHIHVEFKNVRGNDGWIDGSADYLAFEQEKQFLIVKRNLLKALALTKYKKYEYGKGFYQHHRRPHEIVMPDGKVKIVYDEVTLIPLEDVLALKHTIIPKL